MTSHLTLFVKPSPTVTSTLSTRTRSASLCCALPATLQIDNSPPMTSQLIHIKHNMKKKAMEADRNRDIQHENKILVSLSIGGCRRSNEAAHQRFGSILARWIA